MADCNSTRMSDEDIGGGGSAQWNDQGETTIWAFVGDVINVFVGLTLLSCCYTCLFLTSGSL